MRKSNKRLVDEYLVYCQRERGRTPQTVYKYGLSLAQFLAWCGGRHVLDLEADDLRKYVHLPKVKGNAKGPVGDAPAPATVKRKVAELRSFYRWLRDKEKATSENIALEVDAPTVHNENPRPIGDAIWKGLWRSDLSDSDRVAFGLGMFCGLRRSEVVALSPANFAQVPKPMLTGFRRKGGKTGNVPYLSCVQLHAQRRADLLGGGVEWFTEPLARLMRDRQDAGLLLDWLDVDRTRKWSRYAIPEDSLYPQQYNRHLSRALAAAEQPDATPHQLRHAFGTNMLNMGVHILKVSRLMGHSSVTVTERYLLTSDDPLADLLRDDEGEAGGGLTIAGPWG